LQQFRISNHVAKRRPQIVGNGIGKRLQLLVGRVEFRSSFAEFLIEFANLVLSAPALFHLDLEGLAGLTKIGLGPPSDSKERGDNCSPYGEIKKMKQISPGHV